MRQIEGFVNMNGLVRAIENGKQRGSSKSVTIDGTIIWCSAAIQKYNEKYKAHVSVIKNDNIVTETFDILFTREFITLTEAIECIDTNGCVKFEEFTALKGQKIFCPDFSEENET